MLARRCAWYRSRWFRGLCNQEAPQADGEEEAPQVAAQDARSAQEQEVTAGLAGLAGLSGRPSSRGGDGDPKISEPGAPFVGEWISRLAGAADFVRRRAAGDFEVDPESGFDPELNQAVLMPAARALYRSWFRVRMRGLEHVPADGAALVVANHSGVLPFDAIMLQVGVLDEHPAQRNLRLLGADLVYSIPVLGHIARASGHVPANPAEAERLLRSGELVGVFPEGFKGIGKPFRDRYQLQRFGRGGFAKLALQLGVPLVPCAIVGAEEIYPMVANWTEAAARLKLPYFP